MKIHRLFLHELKPIEIDQPCLFDPIFYSKFKYGCVDATRHFASQMADFLSEHLVRFDQVVLTSSAFLTVPNAAASMVNNMRSKLPKSLEYTKLTRNQVFDYDYACLEQTQRHASMRRISLKFNSSEIQDKTLFVVDDAYVTGAHERIITEHMDGIPKNIYFFYLLDLSTCPSPSIENEINRAYVKELADLLPLMTEPSYSLNSRALKQLLNAPFNDFASVTSYLSIDICREICSKALSEGYARNESFHLKISYINQMLEESKVVA